MASAACSGQNLLQLAHTLGVHAFGIVVLEKLPQPPMLETLDHCSPIVMPGSVNRAANVKPYFTQWCR